MLLLTDYFERYDHGCDEQCNGNGNRYPQRETVK